MSKPMDTDTGRSVRVAPDVARSASHSASAATHDVAAGPALDADRRIAHAQGATAPPERRPHLSPTLAERVTLGRDARRRTRRSAHASWTPPLGRPDPVDILTSQDGERLPDLVAIRHGRMLSSAFPFFRGAAAIMAWDLAHTPTTGLRTQLCGDAHLSNFGLYAAPDRRVVFDANDFDETLPGSFEWDVKRLAASAAVAARENGFTLDEQRAAGSAAAEGYVEGVTGLMAQGELGAWYRRIDEDELIRFAEQSAETSTRDEVSKQLAKAHRRTSVQAFSKLAAVEPDGSVYIRSQPPLIVEFTEADKRNELLRVFHDYVRSLPLDRSALLDRYEFRDVARKVVGVGSVGTRCEIMLFTGKDNQDPLLLQMKQAVRSVLEPFAGASAFSNQGERVVQGQRLMQNAHDIFLGWARSDLGHDFYFRQLRDMKGSFVPSTMDPSRLRRYVQLCGHALADGHARGGDRIAIASYLGSGRPFVDAIGQFAIEYADQNDADFERFREAAAASEIRAVEGV